MRTPRELPAKRWFVSGATLGLALVAGCPSPKGGGGGTTPQPVSAGGHARSSDGVLWQATADLDGDGKLDEITLASTHVKVEPGHERDARLNVPVDECDQIHVDPDTGEASMPCPATLTIGGASQDLTLFPGYFGGIGIQVIDIDASDKRQELLLTRRGDSDEDPWYEFTTVIYDGAIHLQDLWHSGGYNSGAVTVDGKGTLTVTYQECPDTSWVSYRLQGTQLTEVKRMSVQMKNPNECAACPWVYLLDGTEFVRQGEILRNLNRASLAGEQTLPLAATPGAATITVELREEKDEVTYLDEVHLDVGGVSVAPNECAAAQPFCAADGAHTLLRRGDVLRLTFSVDAKTPARGDGRPRLVASGYYLPL